MQETWTRVDPNGRRVILAAMTFAVLQETGAQSSANREVIHLATPTASDADRPPGLQWDFTRDGPAKGAAA
jgi:hypothetical protein